MISKKETEELGEHIREKFGVDKIVISTGRYFPKGIEDYVMLFQAITNQLIYNLSPAGSKVLLYMLGKLKYSNHIGVDLKTICEDCNLSIASVSRATKELMKNMILLSYKDEQDKRRNVYIINPYAAWKGTFQERNKRIKKIKDDNQLKMFDAKLLGSSNEKKSLGGLGAGIPQ